MTSLLGTFQRTATPQQARKIKGLGHPCSATRPADVAVRPGRKRLESLICCGVAGVGAGGQTGFPVTCVTAISCSRPTSPVAGFEQMTISSHSCPTFSKGRRYGVIYADPPWSFRTWSAKGTGRSAVSHYDCLDFEQLAALPVADLAA